MTRAQYIGNLIGTLLLLGLIAMAWPYRFYLIPVFGLASPPRDSSSFEEWNFSNKDIHVMMQDSIIGPETEVDGFGGKKFTESAYRYAPWPVNWWQPELNYIWVEQSTGGSYWLSEPVDKVDKIKWSRVQTILQDTLKKGWFPDELEKFAESYSPPFDIKAYAERGEFIKVDSAEPNVYLRYRCGDFGFVCLGEFSAQKLWLYIETPEQLTYQQFVRTCRTFVHPRLLGDGIFITGETEPSTRVYQHPCFESERMTIYYLTKQVWMDERDSEEITDPRELKGWELKKDTENVQLRAGILIELSLPESGE